MRIALYGAALLALTILFSPDFLRGALAASASALFEAAPFVLAGSVVTRLLRRPHAVAYLGCGCTSGPSARSLPAAAATCLVFGPAVAVARVLAASAVAAALRNASRSRTCATEQANLLAELAALLPAVVIAGAATQFAGAIDFTRLPPFVVAALGALLGFTAAPCALGTIAIAGALRPHAPLAAISFLCVAGIVDLRALRARLHGETGHDAFAYSLLAAATAIVAARHGDALIRPAMAPALGACAVVAFVAVVAHRRARAPLQRLAPLLMLAGALVAAPPPRYTATETTLTDLFAGEHLTFTGTLARDRVSSALVRYAITCCRADAFPVVVRLDRAPSFATGSWLRADGRIESVRGEFRLVAAEVEPIAPPTDPFIYR